jgi:hypothetical protein
MSVPEVAYRRTGRPGSLRLSASVAALLGLGAGPAAAALIDSFTWSSNTAGYNTFASTCSNVQGGTGCGSNTPLAGYTTAVNRSDGSGTQGSGIIFSWGTNSAADAEFNSRLIWTNDEAAFTLTEIRLTASLSVGTGLPSSFGFTPGTGSGAAPAWEWASMAFLTQVNQAMVGISVGGGAANNRNLFSGTGGWFTDPNQILQTPINFVSDPALSGLVVGANQSIDLRLFESLWNGRGATPMEGRPDLLFSSITIQFFGTEGPPPPPPPPPPLPLPGTLALFGIGLAALWRRSGQPLRVAA